jgi:hypothetical protein
MEEIAQKKQQNKFVCEICNKTYKTENGLKKHMETKHNKDGEEDGGNRTTSKH